MYVGGESQKPEYFVIFTDILEEDATLKNEI